MVDHELFFCISMTILDDTKNLGGKMQHQITLDVCEFYQNNYKQRKKVCYELIQQFFDLSKIFQISNVHIRVANFLFYISLYKILLKSKVFDLLQQVLFTFLKSRNGILLPKLLESSEHFLVTECFFKLLVNF